MRPQVAEALIKKVLAPPSQKTELIEAKKVNSNMLLQLFMTVYIHNGKKLVMEKAPNAECQ